MSRRRDRRPVTRCGVIGAGRLGRALSERLLASRQVAIYDLDVRKGKQLAKVLAVEFLYLEALLAEVEAVLLCIPGEALEPFFDELGDGPPAGRRGWPTFVNLATGVDTAALRARLGRHDLDILGAKPVGQFAAIRAGLPTTFVTGPGEPQDIAWLADLLADLGQVQVADEALVGPLNRRATEMALRFCRRFEAELGSLEGEPALGSALRNLVVGTVLDYPPSPDNPYTREILQNLGGQG